MKLLKYPRTQHIQGSRLQPGDEDLDSVHFAEIAGRNLVIEEKMDGANSAISFDEDQKLCLQSRGHYLTGGEREKHFDLFKVWANTYAAQLWEILGARYIAYGEWLYAKHTVFYDRLPHYWLEFDVYDRESATFLSTEKRAKLFRNSAITQVQVIFSGIVSRQSDLPKLLGHSNFIGSSHLQKLRELSLNQNLPYEKVLKETDQSAIMEGLYIKEEDETSVTGRFKFVRASFLTSVQQSESHWLNRPIIPNQLIPGTNLFEV